jgi:hypothetical protein
MLHFLVAVLFSCPINFFMSEKSFCTLENPDRIDYARYWNKENPIPQLLATRKDYQPFMILSAYFLIMSISSYLLSMILAKMSLVELKRKSTRLSSRTKSLENQLARSDFYFILISNLFRTLFAQSLCPLSKLIINNN